MLRLFGAVFFLFASQLVAAEEDTAGLKYGKDTFEASVVRGQIVYSSYCVLCHGINGEGNGRAARIYNPRPANLRKSMVPDLYKEMLIRKGGAGWGRSPAMPSWEQELTEEQIHDVVNYLRTIAPPDADK